MKAIRQLNDKHDTVEKAQDHLAGLQNISGFIMGYVDEKEMRVVSYHFDTGHPGDVHRSQKRVDLAFPAATNRDISLAPIAEAMMAAAGKQ